MSDESHMSKYARKVAARQEAARQEAARKASAIDFTMRVTNGDVKVEVKQPKKLRATPPPPRGIIRDLGDRPRALSALIGSAAQSLREAWSVANEILGMAGVGIQQAEPRGIAQFCEVLAARADGMAQRAARILNAPQDAESEREADNGNA